MWESNWLAKTGLRENLAAEAVSGEPHSREVTAAGTVWAIVVLSPSREVSSGRDVALSQQGLITRVRCSSQMLDSQVSVEISA